MINPNSLPPRHFIRVLLLVSAIGLAVPTPPAMAQDSAVVSQRVDRLERELRAVQRRVFPGQEGGVFQPQIAPAEPAPGITTATPPGGAGPIIDLTARVDALETQLARLTGQVEQQGFRMREFEASLAQLRTQIAASGAAPGSALGSAPGSTPGSLPGSTRSNDASPTSLSPAAPRPTSGPTSAPTSALTPAAVTPASAPRPAATTTTTPRPAGVTPAPATGATAAARRARVEAIEVPATGNAAEDDYLYGYRLWEARLFPEAQAQLQAVLRDHPTHRRASYAGNLLGRAMFDNNQVSLAVGAFHDNYRTRPRGERAADSLYYMGMALIRLDRRTDACRTFDEFDRLYGPTASDDLKERVRAGRGQATC